MNLKLVVLGSVVAALLVSGSGLVWAQDGGLEDDLKSLQGMWELRHGNEGKGAPTIRSVKTIQGNRETLKRYSIESGRMLSEKTVEFELNEAGPVRVFTFFPVGGSAKTGFSFVYKIEKDDFYDITGLLHGTEYRDYSKTTTMWHWKRVVEKPATDSKAEQPAEKAKS